MCVHVCVGWVGRCVHVQTHICMFLSWPCLVGWHWRSLLGSFWKKRFSHTIPLRMWQRQYGMGQGEKSRCGFGSISGPAQNPSRRTMTSSSQFSTWKSLLTHWQKARSLPNSPLLSSYPNRQLEICISRLSGTAWEEKHNYSQVLPSTCTSHSGTSL